MPHHGAGQFEKRVAREAVRGPLPRARRALHEPRGAREEDDWLQQPGHEARRARKHEVVFDDGAVRVPEGLRVGAEVLPQRALVQALEGGVVALGEELEEVGVRARADGGQFELQERELRAVHVHRNHLLGTLEHVVEHVAARRGDGEHHVFRAAPQHPVVDGRVLPGDVVDDLLLANGRHDEVLCVHVLHDGEEDVHEEGAGGHVHRRRLHVAHLFQGEDAPRGEPHVQRALHGEKAEEERELDVERHATLLLARPHQVASHPVLEGNEVPAQEHHARGEDELGVGRRGVDEGEVEGAAREEVREAKEEGGLALVLHLEEGEDDHGQLFH
mmetsp:Transcript_11089/g.32826  ORF Transcript_11089/g.32826 Transcript_11089/m.32826 type:complete len:331 (-) Transcript_11089:481-1473(-)